MMWNDTAAVSWRQAADSHRQPTARAVLGSVKGRVDGLTKRQTDGFCLQTA